MSCLNGLPLRRVELDRARRAEADRQPGFAGFGLEPLHQLGDGEQQCVVIRARRADPLAMQDLRAGAHDDALDLGAA